MTPSQLLAELRAAGLWFRLDGETLLAGPKELLTSDRREAIRQHKTALVELLREEQLRPFAHPPPDSPDWIGPAELSEMLDRFASWNGSAGQRSAKAAGVRSAAAKTGKMPLFS